MVKMAIYTQKCGLFTLKNNNKGEWGRGVPGWKKIEKLTIRGGTIIRDSRVNVLPGFL